MDLRFAISESDAVSCGLRRWLPPKRHEEYVRDMPAPRPVYANRLSDRASAPSPIDMGPSTLSSWALLIHRALTARGVDADSLFMRAGMDPIHMRDPNARYPIALMQELWKLATAAVGQSCFGLEVARLWHPTTFHALGYSILASATLRDALLHAARYGRVVTTGASLNLFEDGPEVLVTLSGTPRATELVPDAIDAGVASIVILCRAAGGEGIDPLRVMLAHGDERCTEPLQAFFRCPVELNGPHNAIAFSAADLDAQLPTANKVLLRANDEVLTRLAASLEASELSLRVRSKLIDLMPRGEIDQDTVARALKLSSRSMQRKLREEGTTFRDLVDDTRMHLALHYLDDSSLVVSEIAYLLGFAEVSSFSRAFRRWTGRAPRAAKPNA
jgi:AraC-like DNA-binding protein